MFSIALRRRSVGLCHLSRCSRACSAGSIPKETNAIVMRSHGGLEVLEYGKKVLPTMKPNEVVLELAAGGVNPVDTYIRKGIYAKNPELPFTPGLEGAGRIVAKGSEVSDHAIGDPVAFTCTTGDGGLDSMTGTYARHCVVKAALLLPVPEHLDLVAAAALPIAYLAAHRALFQIGAAKPSDRILVRGASGAVGLAAIALARQLGDPERVLVGTASDTEVNGVWGDRLRSWGATACTTHAHDSVAEHGEFDVIVEQMARFNLDSCVRLLKPNGRVVVVGSPPQSDGRSMGEFDVRQLMTKEVQIRGLFLWQQTAAERRESAADIFKALELWRQAPPVHRMPLAEAQKAQAMVDPDNGGGGQGYDGKIVLVPEV